MPSRAKDQMHRGQMGLNRLNMQMASLSATYARAEARVTSLVARSVIGGTLGTQKVRRALRRDVTIMLNELNDVTIPVALQIIDRAYDLGRRLADAESTGRVDDTALKLLQDNLRDDLHGATTHVGRRVDDIFRKAAVGVLASTKDDPQPNRTLERALRAQGIGSFKDVQGRLWSLEHYASMAVKTTQAEATFTATQLTLTRAGLDLVDINSVSNPCPLCKKIDGGTFSLTGRTKGYKLLPDPLPVHPECQHYAVVSQANFASPRIKAA